MTEEHTIEITGSFELGSDGSDHDRQNPLSRSLDRFLRTGKPPGKLTNCFLIEDTELWRWFGVFGFSEGGRVLFYPGFSGSYDQTSSYVRDERGLRDRGTRSMQIDHVSLEKDLRSMHFTSAGSKQHVGSFPTLSLRKERHLWFGLGVRHPEVFRLLKKDTKAVASGPGSDSKRRAEEFQKSISGQVFQGLELPPGVRAQSGITHFSVIAGPPGFADYTGSDLAFPVGSPFLQEPLTIPDNLPVRRHRISLGAVDLQIVTAWLPGRLDVDMVFTGTGT